MKILILALAFILSFLISGCCEKQIEYVKVPCPTLQTYEVNTTAKKPFQIKYEVVE